MENQSILHDKKVVNTMRKVSKLGVYLPSILLIIAVILVFTAPRKDPKVQALKMAALTPTITPTPTIKININLKGPFTCNYTSATATVSAAIKNKQIAADFIEATQESHFIVRDDCVYIWDTKKPFGSKQCGLGTAIETVDFLSSMGLLDFGSILGMIPSNLQEGSQKDLASNSSGIQKFLETCVKKEPATNVFTVPTDRVFIEPTAAPTPKL